jgi:hypothetical protein
MSSGPRAASGAGGVWGSSSWLRAPKRGPRPDFAVTGHRNVYVSHDFVQRCRAEMSNLHWNLLVGGVLGAHQACGPGEEHGTIPRETSLGRNLQEQAYQASTSHGRTCHLPHTCR